MSPSTAAVALVTGSSRGIGRAVAEQLAADGYHVVVNYLRSGELAEQVADSIRSQGRQALAVSADVGCDQGRQRLLQAAQQLGRLQVLVNNAGITSPGRRDLLEATEDSWDAVFDTNLKGPFFLAQGAAKLMIAQREQGCRDSGRIINVSSISAYAVSTNRADYCLAKSAMQMMTWLLADRLAEHDIRVFEICPGVIASDMTAPVKAKYDALIQQGLSPLRRWGEPQDVARAVSAVAGDSFSFSTGDRINVDGGFHIRRL